MTRMNAYWILILMALGCGKSAVKEETKPDDKKWEITVRGKVGFPQSGIILIREMRPDEQNGLQDTIQLKSDYTFEQKVALTEAGYYQLNFYNRQFVNLILYKDDVEVSVDGNDQAGFSEIKGSSDQDLINVVQKTIKDAQTTPEVQQLTAQFQVAAEAKNETKMMQIQEKYQELLAVSSGKVVEIIRQAPPSLAVIYLLQSGGVVNQDKHFDVYVSAAEKFRTGWPDSYHAKQFVQYVDRIRKTAIGQPAPEISLPDPNGKLMTLSSFKGKFVLVDFWAKWCGPCRRENPNVVKAYQKFKSKKFDILGVSLDRSKEDWLLAIKEDGLVWNHVSDLKYFESKAALDYNINGIPFSILVDPDGIIIAKNLRGNELHRKLGEVLN